MKTGEMNMVRRSGMNRRQFLRNTGVGAAALGAGVMGMSGVASAKPSESGRDFIDLHSALFVNGRTLLDVNDFESFRIFIEHVNATTRLTVRYAMDDEGTTNTPVSFTSLIPPISSSPYKKGVKKWSSGTGTQDSNERWSNLYWHQPFMPQMTPEKMYEWLFEHVDPNTGETGLELRQRLMDEQFPNSNVYVIPYRINPGEGGGYSTKYFDDYGPEEIISMRISGPLTADLMGTSQVVPALANPGASNDLDRFDKSPSSPDDENYNGYLNAYEFHIASTDLDNTALYPNLTRNLATQIIKYPIPEDPLPEDYWGGHYYRNCWWSTASVWMLWIPKNTIKPEEYPLVVEAAKANIRYTMRITRRNVSQALLSLENDYGLTMHDNWPASFLRPIHAEKVRLFDIWRNEATPQGYRFNQVLTSMEDFLGL